MEGWICPVCGAVNAPWAMQCPCKGKMVKPFVKDSTELPHPYTSPTAVEKWKTNATCNTENK